MAYSFRGSAHYHQDREGDSMQADVVLELRFLHLDSEATGSQPSNTVRETWENRPHSPPPKWHTYSKKVIPPNGATPFKDHFLSNSPRPFSSSFQPSSCCDPLIEFPMLWWPLTIKLFSLLLHYCKFVTVMNHNVNNFLQIEVWQNDSEYYAKEISTTSILVGF